MKPIYNNVDLDDIKSVLAQIDGFTSGLGIDQALVNSHAVKAVILGMKIEFPYVDGEDQASPFKKAANFLCFFINTAPVSGRIPEGLGELSSRDLNAAVGLDLAIRSLYKATLHCKDGTTRVLENRIKLSGHSHLDTLDMLKHASPSMHFLIYALLLEQMAYKTNANCQYEKFVYE